MTDKEVIIDELSCKNCPENEKKRCKEQKERKNNIIDIHLQNIKDVAQSYGCNLLKEIENLRQALPNITRCDVVLEKQLRRKEQECKNWQETSLQYAKNMEYYQTEYKRLQVENEELKHNYDAIKQCNKNNMQTLDETIKEKRKAEQKLEKVEKQYKCYSCGTCNGKEDYYNLAGHHENAIKSLHKAQNKSDRYKQALEEIESECNFDNIYTMLEKLDFEKKCKVFLNKTLPASNNDTWVFQNFIFSFLQSTSEYYVDKILNISNKINEVLKDE